MPAATPRASVLVRIALAGALVMSACGTLTHLPELSERDLKPSLTPQTSKIFDGRGELITTFHGAKNRTVVPLRKVPEHVRDAVIAIEDERFYKHDGIDLQGIARAAIENITSGSVEQGGSTITQQYVKNRIIAPGKKRAQKTIERKLEEAALSRQLEARLTKDEILERYLNSVYFGNGAYGIQAAAKTYFGRPARKLSIKQGATLAALIKAPEIYDPYDHPRRGLKRRDLVLSKMEQLEMIGSKRATKARGYKLGLSKRPDDQRHAYPYFVDYVKRLLVYDPRFKVLGKTPGARSKKLFQGGLRIYTTVQPKAQRAAEKAIAAVLTKKRDPYAAMVALDPRDGEVKAMVGGRYYFRKRNRFAKLNLAISGHPGLGASSVAGSKKLVSRAPGTGRQAGSSFKPFALVTAISQGTPLARQLEAPACKTFTRESLIEPWRVCNYGGADYGVVSLFEATIKSINVAYANLILDIGPQEVVETARDMGITSDLQAVPSAVLGTNPVNPLDMASAYGTLATLGTRHAPVAVTKIVDLHGDVIYKDRSRGQRVLEPAVSWIATKTMESVIQQGTGTAAQIGRPAAGKTGTAQEYRDAWFAGFVPQLSAAVWVGYPEASIEMKTSCGSAGPSTCKPTRITVSGGSWPAQIWQGFMSRVMRGRPVRDFPRPAGITQQEVDIRTGCRASAYTPDRYRQSVPIVKGHLAGNESKRCKQQAEEDRKAYEARLEAERKEQERKDQEKAKDDKKHGKKKH